MRRRRFDMNRRSPRGCWWPVARILLAGILCGAGGCDKRAESSRSDASGSGDFPPAANRVDVLFVYGSEKQDWIEAVTPAFNAAHHALPDGRIIHVATKAMGSGESKDDILAGRVKADVWSPASAVFVTLANAEAQTKGGPLVKQTENLVLSPVVIAMWKPMAQALGWPDKAIGWEIGRA